MRRGKSRYNELRRHCIPRQLNFFFNSANTIFCATRFAHCRQYLTNTIISENSKDPWHVGTQSIEENKRNELYKIWGEGGAHHQDLRFEDDRDSGGVKEARRREKAIIKEWLKIG